MTGHILIKQMVGFTGKSLLEMLLLLLPALLLPSDDDGVPPLKPSVRTLYQVPKQFEAIRHSIERSLFSFLAFLVPTAAALSCEERLLFSICVFSFVSIPFRQGFEPPLLLERGASFSVISCFDELLLPHMWSESS